VQNVIIYIDNLFRYFLYPETSGKTLEELDLLYSNVDANSNCDANAKLDV
jgi:hypothetical protein